MVEGNSAFLLFGLRPPLVCIRVPSPLACGTVLKPLTRIDAPVDIIVIFCTMQVTQLVAMRQTLGARCILSHLFLEGRGGGRGEKSKCNS